MGNKKISVLSAASTPLAGTELVPIVQGGATVKVSVANLTAGRAVATAGGTFTDNQTQGTAAKGINFTANTPAAGMTSQLLNWYEEGTWTPSYTSWAISPTTISAIYTRTGRLVTLCLVAVDGVNLSGGVPWSIGGVPVTSSASGWSAGVINNRSNQTTASCSIWASATEISGFNVVFTGQYWLLTITYPV